MMLAENDSSPIFVWSFVLIAAIVVGYLAVIGFKKWLSAPDNLPGGGFTLADLRELHRSGKMTTEEYERAKARILASSQASLAGPKKQDKA